MSVIVVVNSETIISLGKLIVLSMPTSIRKQSVIMTLTAVRTHTIGGKTYRVSHQKL